MIGFWRGLWLIAAIELRQRVGGVAWYVLLGVFVLLLLIVTVLLAITFGLAAEAADGDASPNSGAPIFSTIIYFVLLLGTLVAPALSGNAINGDREAGTLATTQVTLISTTQLVLGKFLAAWLTSLAFLGVAVPFLLVAQILGGVPGSTIGVSLIVLAGELGVVSAIGVGLSGIIRRPLFSVVVTYLVVAALSVGTLIGFTLGGVVLQQRIVVPASSYDDGSGSCQTEASYTTTAPGFDKVWWMLAANPYVVLADAVPSHYEGSDQPGDLFGFIKLGVRSAQLPVDPKSYAYDDCSSRQPYTSPTPREIIDRTVPSWFVGLLLQLALAAALLVGAGRLTRAPSGRLAAGSRIA
jgi:ABC-type transport system involved in multi-copper enzyme maturation permease subunit